MPSEILATHQDAQQKGQLLQEKPIFSCFQVSQPLPATEARDSSPEDSGSCATKPGPSLAPVDHEYPHYLKKVWDWGESSLLGSGLTFSLASVGSSWEKGNRQRKVNVRSISHVCWGAGG